MPNTAVSLSNTADSFKPFNPADAIGDTTPTQAPLPMQAAGCGVLGMVIVIVVMIVVTVLTSGVAAGGSGAVLASTSGTAAAAAGTTVATAGSTWAAGVAALSGGLASTSTAIAASVAGAIVGGVASQGVGIALGVQKDFDWKSVAMGAITAGSGSAVGGLSRAVSAVGKFAAANPNLYSSISAAAGNALGQGIGVVTGLQKSFSWQSVATAAIMAPISRALGQPTKLGLPGEVSVGAQRAFENGIASFSTDIAGSAISVGLRAAMGEEISTEQALADAFGNALGNSIVDGIQTAGVRRQAKSLLEESGYEYGRANHRSSAEFAESLVRQGATRDEALAILRNDEIRSGLLDNDFARSGGISDALAGQRASNFVDEFRRGGATIAAAGENTLEEVTVSAAMRGQSGSTITQKVFSGGLHLVEGLTQLNDQHPTLANFAFTAGKTLLTGGPLKTVVTKLANATFDGVIGDLRGQLSLQAQTATEPRRLLRRQFCVSQAAMA
jgi:hypothetical protein